MEYKVYREFKDRIYEQFARIGKALSSPKRLEVIDLLAQGERSVEDVAGATAMPVANASQHLQVLRAAGMVEVRREGKRAYYRLADEGVYEAWRAVRGLGERRLAEVDRVVETYLEDRGSMRVVDAEELLGLLRDGDDVVVLDVRPKGEYRAGHIAGARSVPVEEIEQRLREIPEGKMVVAYCRGPYCVFSDDAVRLLRSRGYEARMFTQGFPEWRAAGMPVETGC
jgi:DNA-binding transcriptional ArsR family regulator